MQAMTATVFGRDRELAELRSALAEVSAGRGRSVLIEGEPGIGKSALLAACLTAAAHEGVEVLHGTCDELWGRFPFAVLGQALGTERRELCGPAAAATPAVPSTDPVTAGVERLLAAVDQRTAQHPVLVAVDDLHWADEPSLLVWRGLNRMARTSPLLLVGTSRPVPHGEGLRTLRREIRTHGGLILGLAPLPEEGVAAVVEQVCGGRPGPGLAERLTAAHGNPLYIRELIDAFERAGALRVENGFAELRPDPADGPEPDRVDAAVRSLAGAIADRLDFLSRQSLAILRSAALLGPEFSLPELAQVLGREPTALLGDLAEALKSGLLERSGSPERAGSPAGSGSPEKTGSLEKSGALEESSTFIRFRHGLIRRALYEATPEPLRCALVREAAQSLVRSGAATERVAELILGTPEAADGWEIDWLVEHLDELRERAPTVAADLLALSLRGAALEHPRRQRLEDGYAEAVFALARHDEVERVSTEILAHSDDPERLGRASWMLGYTCQRTGRFAEGLQVVTNTAVLARLGDIWRVRLRALRAMLTNESGKPAEARPIAEEALAEARLLADPMAQAYSRQALAMVALVTEDACTASAQWDAILALTATANDLRDIDLLARSNKAVGLAAADRRDEAAEVLREARAVAEREGSPRLGTLLMTSAFQAYEQGNWTQARTDLEAVSELPVLHAFLRVTQEGLLALMAARAGERRAASRHLAALEGQGPVQGWQRARFIRAIMAEAILAEQKGESRRALDTLVQLMPAHSPELSDHGMWMPMLIRLAMDADEPGLVKEGVEVCARDLEHDKAPSTRAAAVWCASAAAQDADRLSAEVADYYRRSGRISELGLALEDTAVAYARDGRPDQARAALNEALEVAAGLGAEWDARRAAARLRALGVMHGARGPRRRPRSGVRALTDTEARIAALVAEGNTNTDIAALLLLSRRTVDTHVSRILSKLDVGSRREVGRVLGSESAS